MARIQCRAPAKLNLFLEVLGKRPDGYHDLETVIHAVDLTDEVTVEVEAGRRSGEPVVAMRCDPAVTAAPEQNLAYRAAEAYLAVAPALPEYSVKIHLQKRIPAQAGLGGGSSDAAAVLRALDALIGGGKGPEALIPVAARLGADVPFFLFGGTAVCEGIGERVTPVQGVPSREFILVLPEFGVSTAEVFSNLSLDLTVPRRLGSVIGSGLPEWAIDGSFNRLADTVFCLFPELAGIGREVNRRAGLRFQVTGSGSGLFAVCSEGTGTFRRMAARLEEIPGVAEVHLVSSFPATSQAI